MAERKVRPPSDTLLSRLTAFFFDRPRFTAILWLAVAVFGFTSYATLLRREGFPSVNIPIAIVGGSHFVNDPARVDQEVTRPISDLALQQASVNTVQSQSGENFFSITIQYQEDVDANLAAQELEKAVNESGAVPSSAQIQYNVPYFGVTGGDLEKIDVAVSFFDRAGTASTAELTAKAEEAAKWLNDRHLSLAENVFVKNPFESVTNPQTGQPMLIQRSFDRYGTRHDNAIQYYDSVLIGVTGVEGADIIELDRQVDEALEELRDDESFRDYDIALSASFADSIKENITELQRVLLEGLLAVLVVGSVVIAIRASLITVISMVTVLLLTLGFLYAIGYTLNVITLFALILSLALIVDDTIIMVEALDAARHRHKDRRQAVKEATRKVSRAMVAATATAALSFAPLIFVGGILGNFIRAIPITIIAALIISLIVALIFIPFLARFILLGKKQMGRKDLAEIAAGIEARIADFITWPMRVSRRSRFDLFVVGSTAVLIGAGFLIGGLIIARSVIFNIFPPTKDSNGLIVTMVFPPGTSIEQAEAIAARADSITADVLGENFVESSYFGSGDEQNATEQIAIVSYNDREVTAPELVREVQDRFNAEFAEARVAVGQLDVGPPAAGFIVQVEAENRTAAFTAAEDIAEYLSRTELERQDGSIAQLTNVNISPSNQYLRHNGRPVVTVSAGFDATDTSTLVTLAQNAVNEEFTGSRLESYGLDADAIAFDIGQESENQESFRTLVIAFPILLAVMYVLLAVQFRSFLQPLLIFMAIPFSIFGVMLGLYLTDNAISFFTMLGFFALVGLSIKNTILLTDFANQARRQGLGAIDSAVAALRERFRPLIATSFTAVVSLIPLALTSPFWEGLAVVLIFGLLSNTLLVVTVFPYYYLGAEFLRMSVSAKAFFVWLVPTLAAAVVVGRFTSVGFGLLVVPLSLTLVILRGFYLRRFAR